MLTSLGVIVARKINHSKGDIEDYSNIIMSLVSPLKYHCCAVKWNSLISYSKCYLMIQYSLQKHSFHITEVLGSFVCYRYLIFSCNIILFLENNREYNKLIFKIDRDNSDMFCVKSCLLYGKISPHLQRFKS